VTDKKREAESNSLRLHRSLIFLLYVSATAAAYKLLLSVPAAHESFIASLSSGAILATFGSAIATIGSLWTGDYANRISLNVDILFKDILKQEAWRRWPFLLRNGTRKLFGGELLQGVLKNPELPFHVGSHNIQIVIPTVQDDFFDLPLLKNIVPLLRFRKAAHTTTFNASKDSLLPGSPLEPMVQFMAYECLTDIWWSVLVFRIARYVVHFGAALTIASAIIACTAAAASAV
jgi:hypothetical protein